MFQSIKDWHDLIDSDFIVPLSLSDIGANYYNAIIGRVIQEYSERKLNVAANIALCFQWYQKTYNYPVAWQLVRAEQEQMLFTPELKADLQKYIVLL